MRTRNDELRVVIVDDDVLACEALRLCLTRAEMNVVGIVHNGLDAVNLVAGLSPDIVLWDDTIHDMDSVGALERIQEICPGLPVMIMMGRGTPNRAANALAAGAVAVMDKVRIDLERLPDMIRVITWGNGAIVEGRLLREMVVNGSASLTDRELAPGPLRSNNGADGELSLRELGILRLLLRDYPDEEIAAELALDIAAVRSDLESICRKLHVEDVSSLGIVAARLGLLEE